MPRLRPDAPDLSPPSDALVELGSVAQHLAASDRSDALDARIRDVFAQRQRMAVRYYRESLTQAQLNQIQALSMLLDRVTAKDLWTLSAQRDSETWKRIRVQAKGLLCGL